MIHPSKPLLPVMLAAFMATTPAFGEPGDKPAEEPNRDKVILEKLESLQKQIDGLKDAIKLNDLAVNKALEKSREVDNLGLQLKAQREQLDRLELSLKLLNDKMSKPHVTAYASPQTEGRIELRNDFPQEMQFIVNQTAYTVQPGETRQVKLAPGTFTFTVPAVPGYQTTQTRTLTTERPYEIRIYPRQ